MERTATDQGVGYWLEEVINTLASEYGWTKDYILNRIYPDEAVIYGKLITKSRLTKYRMQLLIAHNPTAKSPGELFNTIDKQLGKNYGGQSDTIDREGLKRLRNKLAKESKNIKVNK